MSCNSRVAHRYVIFLCNWDVEIYVNDSLVGQLTNSREYDDCRAIDAWTLSVNSREKDTSGVLSLHRYVCVLVCVMNNKEKSGNQINNNVGF